MKKIKRFLSKIRKMVNFDFNNFDESLKKLDYNFSIIDKNTSKIINDVDSIKSNVNFLQQKIFKLDEKINNLNSELSLLQLNFSQPSILICGFYGAFNLGDELMLDILLKKIRSIGNFSITIMLSNNYYTDIQKYGDVKIIYYPTKTSDFSYIADIYDYLIFGGGALIDDDDFKSYEFISLGRILVDLSTEFILKKKKTILYGLSTNDKLHDSDFLRKLSFVIDNCSYFSLRDEKSLKTLSECGINTKKINIVHDLVFCYDYSKFLHDKKLSKKITIGFVYICFNDLKDDIIKFTNDVIHFCKNNNTGIDIKFIPFYNYKNNDEDFYLSLLDKIDYSGLVINRFPKDISELTQQLNECDVVFSMRYHCTLVSNILNKKTICIDYDSHKHYYNKNNYLFEKYNFDKNMIRFSKGFDEKMFKYVISNKNNCFDRTVISKEAVKQLESALSIVKE